MIKTQFKRNVKSSRLKANSGRLPNKYRMIIIINNISIGHIIFSLPVRILASNNLKSTLDKMKII